LALPRGLLLVLHQSFEGYLPLVFGVIFFILADGFFITVELELEVVDGAAQRPAHIDDAAGADYEEHDEEDEQDLQGTNGHQ
jgi:hypothetical protein